MPTASLLLVLLAAVCHAGWNFCAKRAARVGVPFQFWQTVIAMVLYAPWAGWVLVTGHFEWSGMAVAVILASGIIHTVYTASLQHGYRVGDLSVVYPIARGTGPLLSSLVAFSLLGEAPGPLRVAGLLAVVGGILLIATDGRFATFSRPGAMTGVRWGLITGALIASYTVVDGYGVKTVGLAPVLLDWFTYPLRIAVLLPLMAGKLRASMAAMRGHWRDAFVVGAISPLGYILILGALQWGAPISVVAPMREISMMLVALIGMAVLREPVGRARLMGCAAMVAGVILLGLS